MVEHSIILAVADNHVIGRNNQLPWRLSYDLQNFKRLTLGQTLVMGRQTFDSLPAALPDRVSIVVSREHHTNKDVSYTTSYEQAKALAEQHNQDCFWIGGRSCFNFALGFARTIHLTRVHLYPTGDTHFEIDPTSLGFTKTSFETRQENHTFFTLETYKKY